MLNRYDFPLRVLRLFKFVHHHELIQNHIKDDRDNVLQLKEYKLRFIRAVSIRGLLIKIILPILVFNTTQLMKRVNGNYDCKSKTIVTNSNIKY